MSGIDGPTGELPTTAYTITDQQAQDAATYLAKRATRRGTISDLPQVLQALGLMPYTTDHRVFACGCPHEGNSTPGARPGSIRCREHSRDRVVRRFPRNKAGAA